MSTGIIIRDTGLMPQDSIANRNAANAIQVKEWNEQIYGHYKLAVDNYNISMDMGKPYPGPVPNIVPKGYRLLPPDTFGFTWFELVDGVFQPLPLHEKAKSSAELVIPGRIHVGPRNVGDPSGVYYSVMPDDGFPFGQITPSDTRSDDGVVGRFLKVGSAVGGWYLKL